MYKRQFQITYPYTFHAEPGDPFPNLVAHNRKQCGSALYAFHNIAGALGVEGPTTQLIAGWERARRRPFDLGTVHDGGGEARFVEGIGGGLIASGIAAMDADPAAADEALGAKLARAVRCYRETLARLEAVPWVLTLDGRRTEGDYLLVEVLNICSVGPNLVLADGADPSDGSFDVVTAREEDRAELDRFLRRRLEGGEGRLALPTRRARSIEIEGGWEHVHLDDQVRAGAGARTLSIRVEPATLELLV